MAVTLARSHRAKVVQPDNGAGLLKVGDLLASKYRVERILGEGGMGVVVAAHHELLDQHVAVKLLYQDIADREAQSRLLLEARACAKLQSEHVARVVDVDTGADGLPFIVMELLDGADLCQIADARGALPRWLVVDYVLQALEGLAHAHVRGIVHRDLKPSNLFLANRADGTQIIKILDFGISKSPDPIGDASENRRAFQLTGGRAVLGSPPYMSPEQVRSPKTVDHRTDIWSLGIVMYELLTNSMPFGGEEVNETFAQVLEKEPQPIRQIVHGVPDGLERIIMRCLQKNRDHRFADVGELARALAPFGSGTWMHSADRITATLARGADDSMSGARPRVMGPATVDRERMSRSGRRVDSVQPELHGTASTVARFSVLGTPGRNLLALSAVIGAAAIVLIAGTAFRRSHAASLATSKSVDVVSADPPPEVTAVAVGAGPAGIVTAPVHLVGPDSEGPVGNVRDGVQTPVGTVIGASTPQPLPTTTATTTATATAKRPRATSPKHSSGGAGKSLLPAGLPRERQ